MTVVAVQIAQISEVELNSVQCIEFAVNRVDVSYSFLESRSHVTLLNISGIFSGEKNRLRELENFRVDEG